jgi:hypothetical protein
VETGTGKTTLLMSHLSKRHTVFALDVGDSLSRVRSSHLLHSDAVEFVEGPTQVMLPKYRFTEKLQVAIIDGPHGYPFPDLEYYFIYPWLETGALLVLDDVLIPSIRRMFDILAADATFEVLEIVDNNCAFLRRTSTPSIDPVGDGWMEQGYNAAYSRRVTNPSPIRRYGQMAPEWLKRRLPHGLKVWVRRHF